MNPISQFLKPFIDANFNKYTGVHFLFNLGICWITKWFVDPWTSFWITMACAILWEIWEWFTEGLEPYEDENGDPSMDVYIQDTTRDIIVCFISCWVVLV